jgi:hypothetical protein
MARNIKRLKKGEQGRLVAILDSETLAKIDAKRGKLTRNAFGQYALALALKAAAPGKSKAPKAKPKAPKTKPKAKPKAKPTDDTILHVREDVADDESNLSAA